MKKKLLSVFVALTMMLSLVPGEALGVEVERRDEIVSAELIDLGTIVTSAMPIMTIGESDGKVDLTQSNAVDWINRIVVPEWTRTFYDTLVTASNPDSDNAYLIDDIYFNLTQEGNNPLYHQLSYSNQDGTSAGTDTFSAIQVPTGTDTNDQYIRGCIAAAFNAFDRDHPEVFWLSGTQSALAVSSTVGGTTTTTYYFILAMTADSVSNNAHALFDIREANYRNQQTIEEAITKRESDITKINTAVTQEFGLTDSSSRYDWVKAYNSWLTKNNEYNTDLNNGPFEMRECISALDGRTGTDGPVCEGYARAFKVLCDRKDIPCVLVDGHARNSMTSSGEAHMWNYVRMEGDSTNAASDWYAVDVTWNDPTGGTAGAVSGNEGEDWLLVGSDSMVKNMKFIESHPVSNTVSNSTNAVSFTNGPTLEAEAYPRRTLQSLTVNAQPTGVSVPGKNDPDVTVTLSAMATYADSTGPEDVTESAKFALTQETEGVSISGNTLTVGKTAEGGTVSVTATYGGVTSNAISITITRAAPVATTITIDGPKSISIPDAGSNTANYTATVYDQYGNDIGGEIRWSITGTGVSVSGGVVTVTDAATDKGTATLTATSSGISKDFTITTTKLPSHSISFPKTTVEVTYRDAPEANHATCTTGTPVYSSDNANVATVDPNTGAVTVVGAGTATIKATVSGTDQYASAEVSYTLKVNPRSLTGATVTANGTYTYTGNPIVPADGEVTVTLNGQTVPGDQYDITASDNINAGTNTATVTVTGKNNYTGTASGTFTISKADPTGYDTPENLTGKCGQMLSSVILPDRWIWKAPTTVLNTIGEQKYMATYTPEDFNNYNTVDVELVVKVEKGTTEATPGTLPVTNNVAATYIFDLSKLHSKPLANAVYAPVVTVTEAGQAYFAATDVTVSGATLNLTAKAATTEAGTELGTITVTISSDNYEDFTGTITVESSDKRNLTGLPATSAIELTYGQPLSTITLSGTMTDGSTLVDGTFTWKTPDATPDAGSYKAEWIFTPSVNPELYNEATGSVDITVLKAASAGEPAYTAITSSGKTLADATLNVGTITPEGTISWDDPDTTAVTQGTSYTWTFTPADAANYENLTGSILLWENDPVTPPPPPTPPAVVHVTGVALDRSALALTVGGTTQLIATVTPDNAADISVTWSSSNSAVASVSSGAVTALSAGSAVISVTTTDGGHTASCTVTVSAPVTPPYYPDYPDEPDDPVEEEPSTPSTPSTNVSNNNSNNNSNTNTSNPPSTPAAPTVPEVTARPEATVSDNTAVAVVTPDAAEKLVEQAVNGRSDTVVIAPVIGGDVTKAEVTLPAPAVSAIASQTNAELKVETPVADVTIPNDSLSSLGRQGAKIAVTAEKTGDNGVEVAVTVDGQKVENVAIKAAIPTPCGPGTVAKIVDADGNVLSTVRKSNASSDGQTMTVPLDGSAKVIFVENSKAFADVPATNWASDAVAFASSHELMNGTSEESFEPTATMTRAMLAVVLHNLEGNPGAANAANFSDVSGSTWYTEAVQWAAGKGVINGVSEGVFAPDSPITREQLVLMLYRYVGQPAVSGGSLNRFVDATNVSDWAAQAMNWAVSSGVVNGSNGALNPQGSATRAEVAQMLMNFVSSGVL